MRRSLLLFSVVVAVFSTALACDRSSVVLRQQATLTNNLVVLPVSINGSRPLPFVLDTGASATVIDRRQAEGLGLAATTGTDVSTGGGDVDAAEIKAVTLRIGPVALPDLNVFAIDLGGLSAGLGQRIAGILGYEIFHRYVVQIEYAGAVVTLHEPDRYVAPSAGEIIPVAIDEQTPL